MKIVLATTNNGKLVEIQKLLEPLGHQLILQSSLNIPDADETGLSFIENAILKARHAAELSGLPAIADDSGLSVHSLKGAPGIYSARYAGPGASSEQRNQKLLASLAQIPDEQRQAMYYCAAAFMQSATDPTPLIGLGAWLGKILTTPLGTMGFGYDPIFYVPTEDCTAAELDPVIKNRVSHRGLAFADLIEKMTMA